jgi:hypothetical protein
MMVEIEGGSTRLHSMENWLRKRLRTCHKADYGMHERDTYESFLEYVLSSGM